MFVLTYFLSQILKMLILLIGSHCKMCPLPTIRSRMFVLFATDKHARLYCWQCAHFTIGINEQNQHFAELRQKVCLYIHVVVLLTRLPSLNVKLECFVTKKWEKRLPNSSQADYRPWHIPHQELSQRDSVTVEPSCIWAASKERPCFDAAGLNSSTSGRHLIRYEQLRLPCPSMCLLYMGRNHYR